MALISRYTSQKSFEIDLKKEDRHAGRKIYDIINYFDNHFTDNINLEEFIKTKTNLSHSCFNKQFRTVTRTTPREYINTLRINKAKALLENTEISVAEIANMVGYSDPLYFSRFFKKKTGMSPLIYKKSRIG